MQRLKQLLGEEALATAWQGAAHTLAAPGAEVEQSIALARQHYADGKAPGTSVLHGGLKPELAAACMAQRIEREKLLLRVKLAKLLEEQEQKRGSEGAADKHFELRQDDADPDALKGFELVLDDAPVAPPEDVKSLISSIQLDLREIPDEYLVPAGPGEYDPSLFEEQESDPDAVWKGSYHEEGAFLYDEWDFGRQNYRKHWCAVREKDVAPVHDQFPDHTLDKYSGVVKHLRKTFEAMRDEDRLLKRQSDGEGVDIDALVEALADAHDGREMTDRLFTRMHRADRNIAVMFMVDMSGSTRGWINEAEREALILLCEALETLGDRYAIYGFSGMSRKRCEIFRVKNFDEAYDAEIKARISGIKPQDYTRMGFAIRHLSHLLNAVDARTRVLITISDGKPDDFSDYRGEYGIEDPRRALIEARRNGIHPYCITIDEQAHDYLPHMYGAAAYTIIDDVAQLPYKVSDIYRRLTT